ncbi:integrase catalytic domain-containing protein [Trichonephila clavipes]|nr:integrase catalytic domain-containing protein [Trichonephila clavipes]
MPPIVCPQGLAYDPEAKAKVFVKSLEDSFTDNPEPFDNDFIEEVNIETNNYLVNEIDTVPPHNSCKRLIAVDSIFGYLIQGKEDEVNCKDIIANHLIVESEEFDFDRVRNSWSLETIEINPDNEVYLSDKEILKSLEQNTVYTNKRYETRLLWKEDSRELKSNYETAKRRLLGLSKTFEKNEESSYLKYDEIIKEHLRDDIIERMNMNLGQNINTGYFLPHHAVVREQKDSTKVRIVFDASSKGEEKVPRQLWRLGKIIEIHKGRDGKVRSAPIKTSTARDWLLKHHPTPHAFMGLGYYVDVTSHDDKGLGSERIKTYVGFRFIGSRMFSVCCIEYICAP